MIGVNRAGRHHAIARIQRGLMCRELRLALASLRRRGQQLIGRAIVLRLEIAAEQRHLRRRRDRIPARLDRIGRLLRADIEGDADTAADEDEYHSSDATADNPAAIRLLRLLGLLWILWRRRLIVRRGLIRRWLL